MLGLDYRKYELVHFEKALIRPYVVNPKSLSKLSELASFLEKVEKGKKNNYPKDVYSFMIDAYSGPPKNDISGPDLQKIEKALGIVSLPRPSSPFYDHNDHNSHREKSDLFLFTEKNLVPQLIGKGSSRHALGRHYQFKGIGRSPLAHDQDFYHSWGGMVSRDALRALISDNVIESRTLLGGLRTDAIFLYEKEFIPSSPLVFSLRDNSSYRLSQISENFMSPREKVLLKDFIFSKFNGRSGEEALGSIIEHYVHAFSQGVSQRSVSQENLTLDGRFLDTESVDFTKDAQLAPFTVQFSHSKEFKKGQSPSHLLEKGDRLGLYSTWVHELSLCAELTANAYKSIYEISFDWKSMLEDSISKHIPNLDESWKKLLNIEAYARKFVLSNAFPIEEIVWDEELEALCGHFHYIYGYNDLFSSRKKRFFSSAEQDLGASGSHLLRKLELALWDSPKTWESAMKAWELVPGGKK